MELYERAKVQARKVIEEQLQRVPYGEKIHIQKEILEELLFDTVEINRQTGESIKLPVWTGQFLQKIDLSAVSFEDVAWSVLGTYIYDCEYEEAFDKYTIGLLSGPNRDPKYMLEEGKFIDFSDTNAHIDLNSSWEAKRFGEISLAFCSFKGLDLSEVDTSILHSIYESDLSYTNLKVPKPNKDKKVTILESKLNGLDLSDHEIDIEKYIDGDPECMFVGLCSFKDTSLHVKAADTDYELVSRTPKDIIEQSIYNLIQAGNFDGCYFNDVLIKHGDTPTFKSEKERREYEAMTSMMLSSALANLDNHTSKRHV